MAKPIVFDYDGVEIPFEMVKVDRSKLYGYKEQEVLDENGGECQLTTLAEDGKTLIGKGGTGIGYVDADGNWCEKSMLKPVDLEGQEITPVKSSFAAPIPLETEVLIDQYLDHNIRLIYRLESDAVPEQLKQRLIDGAIFQFPYSYRGGLEPDAGFLLNNENGDTFFLVGDATGLEFKGLQATGATVDPDSDSSDDGEDLMDFYTTAESCSISCRCGL